DRNRSHWSTSKTPSYTKSVSWQHHLIAEQKKEPEMTVRYYISSADLTAEKFATAIRNHWHVENKLHWRLDVVMNEDDCRIRRGNAAELFSGIRHIAINILTNDKVFKAGLRR
ncbi:ISAs1 family transposase, partial [Escherichia coli]